ncbi:hypothetical protein ATCC90586_006879 [Pythium insidiosum]|nr:hypothetical protein ATCC90586_006879 [Pythium insidiosum]
MKKLFAKVTSPKGPAVPSPSAKNKAHKKPSNNQSAASSHDTDLDDDGDVHDLSAITMADALSEKQKRGFAGLCACLLPHVNDASTELQWSRTYLQLVVETFLGLPSSQYKAFLPMLTARHDALEEFALSSTSISKDGRVAPPPVILDKLDPAPFVALVVPATGDDGLEQVDTPETKKKKEKGLKGWHLLGKKPKKEEGNNAVEANKGASPATSPAISLPTHQDVQEFQLKILKQLLWFTVKAVGYDARARTLLRVMVETMRLPWKVITVEEISIGRTLFAEATAMPMEKATAKPTGDGMNVYICVSGWLDEDDPPQRGFRRAWGDSREYLRAFYRKTNPEKVDQADQVLDRYKGREDEFFSILRKTYKMGASIEYDPLEMIPSSLAASADENETSPDSQELMRAWRWKDRFPQGDQYCLAWEEELLRKFGKSMRSFAKDQVMSYANNELVQLTAFAALFAAVAIPRTLLRAADIIDNIWVLMMNNADASGKLLAETLRRREQGLRPVTLIGYGMGARLIFMCLKKLSKYDDCHGIVENVVLLGTPLPVVTQDWKNARRVVSGRLINGYSEHDWMLAVMYRYQGWALNSAGIGPIEVPGVENVNLSSIIKGHMEYKNKIGAILDVLGLEA